MQEENLSRLLLQSNVLCMKGDFTGVLALYVTKIEKIGSETRADDIRTMSTIGKIQESLPINSDEMN